MAGVNQIEHKSKIIFIADHKGAQGDEVIKNQELMLQMIKDTGKTDILNLTDMTDVYTTPEVHTKMKEVGNEILKYSKKSAIVGMSTGAKNLLISTFIKLSGKPMKLFNDIEEAKEWLVSA